MSIDFKNLNFHDCSIYAIGFGKANDELLLDIDWVSEWKEEQNGYFSFKLSPCTLVFDNVWDIEMDVSMNMDLVIDEIVKVNPAIPRNIDYLPQNTKEYDWTIELLQGQISFKSIGLALYQRKEKVLKKSQNLSFEERGSISLDKTGEFFKIKHD